ncbi:MAG: hypothetical protein ACLGGX_11620 [Bdellovibrionia bacterium]
MICERLFQKLSLFVILISLFMGSMANATQKACICLMGTEPRRETGFFKKGCEEWISEQKNCSHKSIEFIDYYKKDWQLPASVQGGSLELGYVGHWPDTALSIAYFNNILIPMINKNKVDVSFDNTACNGLDDAKKFTGYFDILKDYYSNMHSLNSSRYPLPTWMTKTIKYRANQVVSVGMWDRFVGGSSMNFYADVDLNKSTVKYPSCSKFLDKVCHQGMQKGQSGLCEELDGSIKTLSCCEQDPIYGGSSGAFWEAKTSCK